MIEFRIDDMTCGHCVSTITKVVKDTDPKAIVEIDLPAHLVRIESSLGAGQMASAISEAGFTPVSTH